MEKQTIAARRQYAKVVHVEEDGDFMQVQFIRRNGEKVIGIYKRCGWAAPPFDEAQKFKDIMNAAPRLIFRKR